MLTFFKHLFFGPRSETKKGKFKIDDERASIETEETVYFGIFHKIKLLEDMKFPLQNLAAGSTGVGFTKQAAIVQLQNMVYRTKAINGIKIT